MDARELEDTVTIEKEERISSVKKGAWSSQEDSLLINYIAINGEGRWNFVALHSGLRRTGKSCRLRWKNYLQPNVRRGNFTLDEQLRIMELHCCYGNRWSKIAGYLPGRTDNEIKNYWRCRVVKQAKQLKYDINGVELREFVRDICLPWLSERIHATLSNNTNTNNVIGNGVVTNYDVTENTGPEALEAGRWASWSDSIPHEPHGGPSSLGLGDPMLFGVNFGESYYAYDGYGFEGTHSPVRFDYDEFSNIYATT